ncbi:hypothetical protein L6452_38080 [Arctium lappa]|uniref:Uncharacterized protein n=1 Tax=Arctium lappa TaxID=4217 RepID=A0ACB8Y5G2_ARCLA|nr:hypothetical protein L6452_38080 [Arctium lappa]
MEAFIRFLVGDGERWTSSLSDYTSHPFTGFKSIYIRNLSTAALMERIPSRWPRPVWHGPWKNYRVISGHLGWVRSIAFDPSNQWFCTGSADRTIKVILEA